MDSSAPLVIHQPNFNFDSVEKIHLLTYNWQSYYCKHTLCWSGVSMERSKSNLELDGNYTIKVGIHGWCTPVTTLWPFWLLLSTTSREMTPVIRWSEYFVYSNQCRQVLSRLFFSFLRWAFFTKVHHVRVWIVRYIRVYVTVICVIWSGCMMNSICQLILILQRFILPTLLFLFLGAHWMVRSKAIK